VSRTPARLNARHLRYSRASSWCPPITSGPGISVAVADTIAGLTEQIGVDPTRLSAAVAAYDASIESARPFDPTIEQGRRADVAPPRSNWPSALETPLFHANRPLQPGIRSNSVL